MLNNAPLLSRNSAPNQTLFSLLERCKSMLELKKIHALVITSGVSQDEPVVSSILTFSAISDSGNIDYGYRVLLHISNPSIFSWNTLIRGYSNSKNPNRSLSVFVKMLRLGFSPDHLTYPFLAKASARLLRRELGVSIHGHIVRTGFDCDRFIQNSLIHMYASCRDILYARNVFDEITTKNSVSWNSMLDAYAKCCNVSMARELFELMPERDVVSWSSLIDGYVKSGEYGEALAIFDAMCSTGPKANEVTMVSVLCACAHLGALDKGKMMHLYMIDYGLPLTLVLRTSLVDMHAKCGAIEEAMAVFRGIPVHSTDVLIWNSMIGGFAMHGFVLESLGLYTEMQIAGIRPDEITYLCLLSACAHGGLVREAWHFFECIEKQGMAAKSEHYACMVDVLARAGQVAEAYKFLCQMPVEPTASTLGALLNGCMNHGKFDLAEIIGRKLIELEPNHDGRYVGLSNVYAVLRRWDEARTMREAMERRGVKKTPGFSFLEMSGALHPFIAHDRLHPYSEQIYRMLKFLVGQMELDADTENQEHLLYDIEVV
ncbi:pentatricopeptide repeat-containing protein [Tripterygium wilfordii]|uniref:Pentatricopeptide repeat-containing protein n=1 Tax=Tripterygium wilfordii TaxID=458696 RepID=A0A7J7DM06_TRIWF|nr:pentatricopeptide repeat-containing protein At5g08305-like [Tripterygium wilfordii]KAF5747400.1 pentatricopeptide repeat-containing protein [Tripterygium wilfordii]